MEIHLACSHAHVTCHIWCVTCLNYGTSLLTTSFPGSLILSPGASDKMRDPGNEVGLLTVTCPCKKSSGVAILVSLQECGFSRISLHTWIPTPESHRQKLGLRSTSSNAINCLVRCVKVLIYKISKKQSQTRMHT